MAAKRKRIPRYSKVQINGHEYYKTDIEDADGKRVILYGKTREEVYDKEMAALEQIDNATFRRKSPTVAEYCEKWLLMQSVHIRATTLIDYTSKVRRHIIKELGEKRMADVTLDDIQVALVPVSKKSASVQSVEKVQRKLGIFACIRYNGSGGEKDAETRKNGSGCSGDRGDRQPGAKGAPAAEDR